MDTNVSISGLAPFSLRDAPALIERVLPAQKIGIEAQKERKAGAGQTLTALGSYWKGRKPLVLVRATVLASLLPATEDPEADLEVFDLLMRMDAEGMWRRNPKVTADHVWASAAITEKEKHDHIQPPNETGSGSAAWRRIDLSAFEREIIAAREAATAGIKLAEAATGGREERLAAVDLAKAVNLAAYEGIQRRRTAEREHVQQARKALQRRAMTSMPFAQQVGICDRVEEMEDLNDEASSFCADIWDQVNGHLGTVARTLPDLIQQLGVARFGKTPVVGDPFCGGGSIPFEAARIGCDVAASDLNPIATMLTWGGLNIIGASATRRYDIAQEQERISDQVNKELSDLNIETDGAGNKAKAYLYCLETVDPLTGWLVPMAPSWVISRARRVVGRLHPDYSRKRFAIMIEEGVSDADLDAANEGTIRDGCLVYRLALVRGGEEREWRVPVARLRGDSDGGQISGRMRSNRLRLWEKHDVCPRRTRRGGRDRCVVGRGRLAGTLVLHPMDERSGYLTRPNSSTHVFRRTE
jgi:putative DNA methylase